MPFIGYFYYNDNQLGVFYEEDNSYKIHSLAIKTFIIDEELEEKQSNHFGPDIKFLPQLILDSTKFIQVFKTVQIRPFFLCNLKYFIDKSIIFRKGMVDIFGIQWNLKEGYDSPILLSEDEVILNFNF
jgi:hypothetical protein